MVKHYLLLEDKDYAEAAEASLESQVPHAEAHAFVWGKEGQERGNRILFSRTFHENPCFLGTIGY
jgi:hypothetical protein